MFLAGMEVISFLAIDVVPKCLIGKCQMVSLSHVLHHICVSCPLRPTPALVSSFTPLACMLMGCIIIS